MIHRVQDFREIKKNTDDVVSICDWFHQFTKKDNYSAMYEECIFPSIFMYM